MGKLLEHLLRLRLQAEVERSGDLADSQFGFRAGRSTTDAIRRVQEVAEVASRGAWQHKDLCVLITLDVKNAFNSAPWQGIVNELRRREMAPYLIRMICSYFSDRSLHVTSTDRMKVTRGVPQGSVLGPILWNVYYDGVLQLEMPVGVTLVGYADDLAIVATAKTEYALKTAVEHAVFIVNQWMISRKLELAPQKTEAVVLAGRRKLKEMTIEMEGVAVNTSRAIRYLGVMMDKDMRMTEHIKMITRKAEATAMTLGRLMPNIGGPRASKRRTIGAVVYSVLLYGAPTWERALRYAKYRKLLEKVQRRIALRICSAYRTVSLEAVVLLAGTPPIDLLVDERVEVHNRGSNLRKTIRSEILNRWKERWDAMDGRAAWTKELVGDIRKWINRPHGETSYYLTQIMTGHGCFQEYLYRFKRAESEACWYCGLPDTARHTFFECDRWVDVRVHAETEVGETLTAQNVVEVMLESEKNWHIIEHMAAEILSTKEADDRARQRGALHLPDRGQDG